jgi:hypothetical protein
MLDSKTHMYLKTTIQKHLNYIKYLEKQLYKTTHELDIFRIKNDLRSEEIIINWLRKKLQRLAY